MIARVVLNQKSSAADRIFDYLVPDDMLGQITIGNRIVVPFGKSNKPTEAFVFSLQNESTCDESKLKTVSGIIDSYVYFNEKTIELIEFMRHRYFCTYISAIKCVIPSGINAKIEQCVSLIEGKLEEAYEFSKHSTTATKILKMLETYGTSCVDSLKSDIKKNNVTAMIRKLKANGFVDMMVKTSEQISDSTRTHVELIADRYDVYKIIDSIQKKAPARARVLEFLCENSDMELSELLEYSETSKSTVDEVVKRGYAAYYDVAYYDSDLSYTNDVHYKRHTLTKQQAEVVNVVSDVIDSGEKMTFLIHGVTGSGKTEVYLNLIEKTISKNKNAIMLVPEISLTPQMLSQIFARFGDNVAVIHSKLTPKQRFNEWKKIKNGDVQIAVGARSAVFAPFSDIGLIIVDEEHENTYKAEMSPKYNTIEIARLISSQNNSVLVLASATPSVESYFKASIGSYRLLEMPDRTNNSPLPDVYIADMREEFSEGNMSIFSNTLKTKIAHALERKEQIILFLNRRGFSGFVSCRNCGYVMQCPNCSVSLKYHKYSNRMICHYCDYKTVVKTICPKCQSKHIRYFGIGTERVVEEINKQFPGATVIRMDADTTTKKYDHEKILNTFRENKADILVGTQMITKGLDFANVTLVGILAADMTLNIDDYRAGERTFDLVTQVIGRAGRGDKKGEAVIQTYNPDDEVIIHSANQDYKKFYQNEIKLRQMLVNPPFTEFVNFLFVSKIGKNALKCANEFHRRLNDCLKNQKESYVLFNPGETSISKLGGKYRYHFLLKTVYKKQLYDYIHSIYDEYKGKYADVSILIEINPNNM